VVDLSSSDEEYLIPDISRDEEFTKRLFGDLNHELLRPPDDDKVIILSDSDEEEEEVHQETADVEAVLSSAVKSPTSTSSSVAVDDAPEAVQDDSNDGHTPDRAHGGSSSGGDETGSP
jgi:hypothetical protein